ncbi:MAG: PilZ domain-containing protein [Pseudomonadota bacterium]|nr:PilZ domain-containing protein [Pseudomonadota bacterium]
MSNRRLRIAIRSTDQLKNAYIPFLKKGGLIIPSDPNHEIGSKIPLKVELMDYPHPFNIIGKIVWLTPETIQLPKLNGTGVEFVGGDDDALCQIIREYIGIPRINRQLSI